jgi:hypothetical protein
MSVRLGVLFVFSWVVATGCATAPVRDVNADRIDTAMAPEQGEPPEGIALGQDAPPLAAPWPAPTPIVRRPWGARWGRVINHLAPGEVPAVTVGNVNIGTPTPAVAPAITSYSGPAVVLR